MKNGAKFVFIAVQTGNMKNESPKRSFFRFSDLQKAKFVSLDDVVSVRVLRRNGKAIIKIKAVLKQTTLLTRIKVQTKPDVVELVSRGCFDQVYRVAFKSSRQNCLFHKVVLLINYTVFIMYIKIYFLKLTDEKTPFFIRIILLFVMYVLLTERLQ